MSSSTLRFWQRTRKPSLGRSWPQQLELLETRQLLAADLAGVSEVSDAVVSPVEPSSVHGRKWEDLNANGHLDAAEPGLPGVIIYSDLDNNGLLDRGEPRTITMRDVPETDFDEAGLYNLTGLRPGIHHIREVVPDGFEQTFPPLRAPSADDTVEVERDAFASVEPGRLVMTLGAGERILEGVAVTVNPYCIRPIDVDVVPSDPDIEFRNLSGQQLNGCGGDTSKFEVAFVGDGQSHRFELQFVDALSNDAFASIPVYILAPHSGGAHTVVLSAGQGVDDINFGNHRIDVQPGALAGLKWWDQNRNGERDETEPGLAGVTVYLDLNHNSQLDRGEPWQLTQEDDAETRIDETGRYVFRDLRPGEYTVREIVPEGFAQSHPGSVMIDATASRNLLAGVALSFDLVNAQPAFTDNGALGVRLTYEVVWPNSCGQLLPDQTNVVVGEGQVNVDMFGVQTSQVCLEVLTTQRLSVIVDRVPARKFEVNAVLNEATAPGRVFRDAFLSESKLTVGRDGGHVVNIESGEIQRGVNFGNFRVPVGDFNYDNRVDADDIDILAAAIRSFDTSLEYDLSGDNQVDLRDLVTMVKQVLNTYFGDANLDGQFNSDDLIEVLAAGEYHDDIEGNSGWAEGDFNGDGDFDSSDLILALADGGYSNPVNSTSRGLMAAAVDAVMLTDNKPSGRRR